MCAYPCVTPSEPPWGRPRSLLSAGPRGRPTPGPRGERETAATGDHGPRQAAAAAIDAATLAPPGGRRGKLPRGSPPAPSPPPAVSRRAIVPVRSIVTRDWGDAAGADGGGRGRGEVVGQPRHRLPHGVRFIWMLL